MVSMGGPERELRSQILGLAQSYRADANTFDQMAMDVPWHGDEFREISRLKFGQANAWAAKYRMSWEELLNDPAIRRDFPWVKPRQTN